MIIFVDAIFCRGVPFHFGRCAVCCLSASPGLFSIFSANFKLLLPYFNVLNLLN